MDMDEDQRSKAKCAAIGLLVLSIIGTNLWMILLASFILAAISGDKDKWDGWSCCVKAMFGIALLLSIVSILCVVIFAIMLFGQQGGQPYGLDMIFVACMLFVQLCLAIRAYNCFQWMCPETCCQSFAQQTFQPPTQQTYQPPGC